MSDSKIITRTSIGHAGGLGSLYNGTVDQVLPRSILKSDIPATAVDTIDAPYTDFQLCVTDTYEEKLKCLNVGTDLGASFLAGLVSVSGSGMFLHGSNASTKQASTICNIRTKSETLLLANEDLRSVLDFAALDVEEATHVIVGIEWGARSVVTVKRTGNTVHNGMKLEGGAGGSRGQTQSTYALPPPSGTDASVKFPQIDNPYILEVLAKSLGKVHAGGGAQFSNKLHDDLASSFEFQIFADIVMDGATPTTYEGVCNYIKNIPSGLRTTNGGKGVPLVYHLAPVDEVSKMLGGQILLERRLNSLDEDCIESFIEHFDRFAEIKQCLKDYHDLLSSHTYCFSRKQIEASEKALNRVNSRERELKARFSSTLIDVRSGESTAQELRDLYALFLLTQWTDGVWETGLIGGPRFTASEDMTQPLLGDRMGDR